MVNRRRIALVFLYRRSRGRSAGASSIRSRSITVMPLKSSEKAQGVVLTLGVLALVQLPDVLPLLLVDDGQDSGDRLSDTVATKRRARSSQSAGPLPGFSLRPWSLGEVKVWVRGVCVCASSGGKPGAPRSGPFDSVEDARILEVCRPRCSFRGVPCTACMTDIVSLSRFFGHCRYMFGFHRADVVRRLSFLDFDIPVFHSCRP